MRPFSLPTFADFYDGLTYPVGSTLGVDVGANDWEIVSGSFASVENIWTPPAATEIAGSGVARLKGAWGGDQWVAANNIIPLGEAFGTFQAVRVQANGDCYYISNVGYDDPATGVEFIVSRMVAGSKTDIGSVWVVTPIDGISFWDGIVGMLEVSGANPVELRVTAILPQESAYPSHVGEYLPHWVASSVLVDASASRIVAPGAPGLFATAAVPWGGLLGFSAGRIAVADTTYPTDTTWEVLVPASEAQGTFEAVASTGESATIEVAAPNVDLAGSAAGRGAGVATIRSVHPLAGSGRGVGALLAVPRSTLRGAGSGAGVGLGVAAAVGTIVVPPSIAIGIRAEALDGSIAEFSTPEMLFLAGNGDSYGLGVAPTGYYGDPENAVAVALVALAEGGSGAVALARSQLYAFAQGQGVGGGRASFAAPVAGGFNFWVWNGSAWV